MSRYRIRTGLAGRAPARGWFQTLALVVMCALALLAMSSVVRADDKDEGSVAPGGAGSVFVPTSEWQAIPRGASIPPGLHVRMDLTTGERYAKLIDADPSEPAKTVNLTSVMLSPTQDSAPEPSDPLSKSRRMKEKVLDKLPPAELKAMELDLAKAKAELEEEKYWELVESAWEQRQALIQKVYDNMLKPAEALGKIIGTISKPQNATHEDMRDALERLEDFLGDIDMTRDFHTLGGWPHLVRLLDPEHHTEVRWRAAWALGNAVKNDETFQQWAIEGSADGKSALTRLLGVLGEGQAAVGEDLGQHHPGRDAAPDELLRKAVYALTSAARGNSNVQARLLEAGGLDVLGSLLTAPFASTPLRVKVATFGVDMLTEAGQGEHEHFVGLTTAVTSPTWCEGAVTLLHDVHTSPTDTEKVLLSLEALHGHCEKAGAFPAKRLHTTLATVREVYRDCEGVHETYREDLLGAVERMMRKVVPPHRIEL